ncbi:hypothetical protein ACQY1H_14100 [Agrobacterium vitis]|uniref:hypothetical protein n=1 Tax=Agrobacterium vitis TaxID=373 RepID=UPI003D269E4C
MKTDQHRIIEQAKLAGLDKAIAEFPDDIFTAARMAEEAKRGIAHPADPLSEISKAIFTGIRK